MKRLLRQTYRRTMRTGLWLRRMKYSRGFGVQSPWAYSFVRYVINEHYPYYAYDRLKAEYPQLDAELRKVGLFYFRLANYAQADHWYFCNTGSAYYSSCVAYGCRKSEIADLKSADKPFVGRSVFVVSAADIDISFLDQLAGKLSAEDIIVVEGIHRSRQSLQAWKQLKAHQASGVTFDLYYCGVVFFDRAMYKQHYTINF